MARLYSNENFPLPVVEELRRLGHDVLTIQEAGQANQEFLDEAVLSFAAENKRAVLTINRKHFVKLHKANTDHQGVIVCSIDLDFAGQARRIDEAIQDHDSLAGILIRINRPQTD